MTNASPSFSAACLRPECGYLVSHDSPLCTKCGAPNARYISPGERRLAAVKMLLLQEDVAGALRELDDVEGVWTIARCKEVER